MKNLIIIFCFFVLLACKKDIIEGRKIIHITVVSEDNLALDSIMFEISKSVPVVYSSVTKSYTNTEGVCRLEFEYNTEKFASYHLTSNGIREAFIFRIENDTLTHYSINKDLPSLNFKEKSEFDVNIKILP